ncbi:MAG TPA: hypothetical protein VN223_10475, partial [Candidatus Elarobacter sp.]|nr:hypothetical protein [Candidatus Elarobacter sp.]
MVGAVLVLTQMSAFAGQIAVLRNGFSIHFDRKEQSANSTRLFTATGYLDIASDQITSFEEDETPLIPEPPTTEPPATQLASQPLENKLALKQPSAKPPSASRPVAAANKQTTTVPSVAAQEIDLDQVVREASSRNRLDPDFVASV